MVGVAVGVQGRDELQAQFIDQCTIAQVLLEHRVDDHRLPRGGTPQQVGVGRRSGIEQLPEDQFTGHRVLQTSTGAALMHHKPPWPACSHSSNWRNRIKGATGGADIAPF